MKALIIFALIALIYCSSNSLFSNTREFVSLECPDEKIRLKGDVCGIMVEKTVTEGKKTDFHCGVCPTNYQGNSND